MCGFLPLLTLRTLHAEEPRTAEKRVFEAFDEFLCAVSAEEQHTASDAAKKIIQEPEAARSLIPQIFAFIRELPDPATMKGTDFSYRIDAAKMLAGIGKPAALALVDLIAQGDAKVARPVIYSVPGGTTVLGSKNYEAAEDELYPSEIEYSRFETIAEAFALLAIEAAPAVPGLIELLGSPAADIRAQAAHCLSSVGPLASSAIPRLKLLASDPDPLCRQRSIHALVLLETDEEQLISLFIGALADTSSEVRQTALQLIPRTAKQAPELVDHLLAIVRGSELDPPELQGAEQRLFAPRLKDVEVGQALTALRIIGLRNPQQCDLVGELLCAAKGRIDSAVRDGLGSLLREAGAHANSAIEQWVQGSLEASDETQVAALLVALNAEPALDTIAPLIVERVIALDRKHVRPGRRKPFRLPTDESPLERSVLTLTLQLGRVGESAALRIRELASGDDLEKEFAVSLASMMASRGVASAIEWVIEELPRARKEIQLQMIRSLGEAGQKAAAAVPAIEQTVTDFTYTRYDPDETVVNVIQEAYSALSQITLNVDHWITRSEERLLQPMLRELPRSNDRSVTGYLVSVTDLGAVAAPHLRRWISGDDADLARETMESVIVAGSFNPELAVAMISTVLRHPEHLYHLGRDYMFPEFAAQAGTAGGDAADLLLGCLEMRLRTTSDPAELEELRGSPWSRYSMSGTFRLKSLLDAFRALGTTVVHEVQPSLVVFYEQESMEEGNFLADSQPRPLVLRTLQALGVDLRPLARKWVPLLIAPIASKYEVSGILRELGIYGPLAIEAVPELLRHCRFKRPYHEQALEALGNIAGDDPRVLAMQRIARFNNR